MNRSTAAAVAVAAVLGISGGTWVGATLGTDDDPDASDNTGETTSPSGTRSRTRKPTQSQSPSSPAPLLSLDATTIHDGYTHIDVEGFDFPTVDSLVRIRGGWLVLERSATDEQAFDASTVAVTGEATELGTFTGTWDISLDGDLFVGLRGSDYTVIDLATGEATDLAVEGPGGTAPTANVTVAGPAILTAWVAEDGTRRTLRTELASGRSRLLETGTLTGWTASPGGLLLTGQVSNGAITCLRGGALSEVDSWWTACDWTLDESRPKYSPNGEQLLAVPLDPDGGPPGTYGVLGSGGGDLIATIDAPAHAVDAEWGDNNEVFVLARRTPTSPANMLYRCQVGDDCVLERPGQAPLILGVGV